MVLHPRRFGVTRQNFFSKRHEQKYGSMFISSEFALIYKGFNFLVINEEFGYGVGVCFATRMVNEALGYNMISLEACWTLQACR